MTAANTATVKLLTQASIATLLCALVGIMLWLQHEERKEERREKMNELMPVLESLAKSLEQIADTYRGQ
jgi:ABC-type uncharacterized transport system permease subunit